MLIYSTIILNDLTFSSFDENIRYDGLCNIKMKETSFLFTSTDKDSKKVYFLIGITNQNISQKK